MYSFIFSGKLFKNILSSTQFPVLNSFWTNRLAWPDDPGEGASFFWKNHKFRFFGLPRKIRIEFRAGLRRFLSFERLICVFCFTVKSALFASGFSRGAPRSTGVGTRPIVRQSFGQIARTSRFGGSFYRDSCGRIKYIILVYHPFDFITTVRMCVLSVHKY